MCMVKKNAFVVDEISDIINDNIQRTQYKSAIIVCNGRIAVSIKYKMA